VQQESSRVAPKPSDASHFRVTVPTARQSLRRGRNVPGHISGSWCSACSSVSSKVTVRHQGHRNDFCRKRLAAYDQANSRAGRSEHGIDIAHCDRPPEARREAPEVDHQASRSLNPPARPCLRAKTPRASAMAHDRSPASLAHSQRIRQPRAGVSRSTIRVPPRHGQLC
jgi:hypothetical protein